jgi:hypothetical protein
LTEINDPGAFAAPAPGTAAAAIGAREAAWAAVRGRQQTSDLPGLVLAQMALELIDAAARHRDEQSFVRNRDARIDADADTGGQSDSCGPPQPELAGICC